MSDVTASISLTKAQQGKLYMQNLQRGERIAELRAGLKRISEMAEATQNFEILTAAKALLEPVKKD